MGKEEIDVNNLAIGLIIMFVLGVAFGIFLGGWIFG